MSTDGLDRLRATRTTPRMLAIKASQLGQIILAESQANEKAPTDSPR